MVLWYSRIEQVAIPGTPLRYAPGCSADAQHRSAVPGIVLPEPPGDVFLRQLVRWVREDLFRAIELNQFAQIHERREIRHASGLLHVVRDDDDCHPLAQAADELFDSPR